MSGRVMLIMLAEGGINWGPMPCTPLQVEKAAALTIRDHLLRKVRLLCTKSATESVQTSHVDL